MAAADPDDLLETVVARHHGHAPSQAGSGDKAEACLDQGISGKTDRTTGEGIVHVTHGHDQRDCAKDVWLTFGIHEDQLRTR